MVSFLVEELVLHYDLLAWGAPRQHNARLGLGFCSEVHRLPGNWHGEGAEGAEEAR